jgi:hypothetical protein
MKYLKEWQTSNYQDVKYLIDSGINIKETDEEGKNALFYFVESYYKQSDLVLNLLV